MIKAGLTWQFLVCIFLFNQKIPAQETYGIKDPAKDYNEYCSDCVAKIMALPPEIVFGVTRYNDDILFIVNDMQWFNLIFNDKDDGIAVDIIKKSSYTCRVNKLPPPKSNIFKGKLLPPVFLKAMLKTNSPTKALDVIVKIGEIPQEFKGEEIELNMLIIKNDRLCHYRRFYDIPGFKWNLLEMNLYMDTLASEKNEDKFFTINKELEFVIPFEKNKYEYKPEDLKPVYDSLSLSKFDIQSLKIRAFSSVEGPEQKNIVLQEKRAESIVNALQSFQDLSIQKEITASENWVEFLNDVSSTNFSNLKQQSKEEIKKVLEKKEVSESLEPILSKHRKAILFIKLSKKNKLEKSSDEDLKKMYGGALTSHNVRLACEIQKVIFANIENKKSPASLLNSLEVPEQLEFSALSVNKLAFSYNANISSLYVALQEFEKLEVLLPQNVQVLYNICVLKLKMLSENELATNRKKVFEDIQALERRKIDHRLTKRLWINYYIILSEYLMQERKYAEKDKSLNSIYTTYKGLNLEDKDLVRLAQYFSIYTKYDWARGILAQRIKNIDVSEDLIFYYLNLTITDQQNASKPEYRGIMLNAINTNKKRFCEMFNPFGSGGISFQLLENDFIRKTYCENCK